MNLVTSSAITMSSREIAELVGATHDNVMKTVRGLIGKGVVFGNETPYKNKQNRQTYMEFILDFRNTMVVVSGYSAELRAKIIDRWQELEKVVAENASAIESRKVARLESSDLTDAIKRDRQTAGKDLRPHNFSNEFDMINRIALGMTAKAFRAHHELDKAEPIRDHLSNLEIKCVEHLQRLNTSLIEINMPYESRKQHLNKVYLLRHKRGLIAEVLRIEQ